MSPSAELYMRYFNSVNGLKNNMKHLFLILFIQFVCVHLDARPLGRNIAYSDDNVRFTVISDGVMRLEYSPDGRFVDNKSFLAVERVYPAVDYKVRQTRRSVEITTAKMKLTYKKGSGKFNSSNLEIISGKGMFPFVWKPGTKQKNNLKGTYRTLDGMDGIVQTVGWVRDSRLNDTLKLEDGLLATDGWTLLDDSEGMLFDDDTEWPWVKQRDVKNAESQDWYFMAYGHDYKSALKDYTLFAGKVPMLPRYAFGYWWSRYWAYSDNEIRDLIDNFRTYGIPLDVMVIDMDWHYTEPGKGGWTGWTWNRSLFPDPEGLLGYLKNEGCHVTLNLHPADGVAPFEEQYKAVARALGKNPDSKDTIRWVNSDKGLIKSVFDNILVPMENMGVDFWWLDWQQDLYDPEMKELSNTWWINYAFFSHMERFTKKRPMLYHRWGGIGNHRYQTGFSGDAVVSWKSLDFQPYFNSTASNVLYGYWSHDIGGHIGNSINPEMYIRWMQFGAFSPIMRTHSQKGAGMNKEPWVFEKKYSDILRQTIRGRYNLVPYIYAMSRKTYDDGISLCRPMYYDYPENREAYEFRNEYMFGDNILVCPITSPMNGEYSKINVWLPEGKWYEMHTGTLLDGNRIVERSFALDEYPVYVKAGSIIPMYAEKLINLSEVEDEEIVLNVFPGGHGTFSFSLYEDGGISKDYADRYSTTQLTHSRNGNISEIIVEPRIGTYEGMKPARDFSLKLIASAVPASVTVNGSPAAFEYVGQEFAVSVKLPSLPCGEKAVVKVVYDDSDDININGIYGVSRKMSDAIEELKYRNANICLNEELGKMGSICEAVTYHPELLQEWCASFWKSYNELPDVLRHQGLKEKDIDWMLRTVNWKYQ